MSQIPDGDGPPLADPGERTRELPLPSRSAPVEPAPVPASAAAPSTTPTAEAVGGPPPVPAEPGEDDGPRPVVLADQPTDQLAPPAVRQRTAAFGPWQPLTPRVVPSRRRSRTPYVVAALVVLVLAVGIAAVLVYGG